jgi:PTH2 family peptidyl-tRNA hydrolase
MSTGKLAAQVAHAAVLGVDAASIAHREWVKGWRLEGQPKIVVQVDTGDELAGVCAQVERAGLPMALVHDRGLTQVPAGTATCAAIGPAPADRIDAITGALRPL